MSLISLGFSTLGRGDYYYDFEVCSEYGGIAHSIYHGFSYYGLLIGSFAAMIWMKYRILGVEKVGDARIFQPTYVIAKSSLRLYPMALFVCWVPHMVLVFIQYDHSVGGEGFVIVYVIAEMLKIFHGMVTSVIFFHKSSEARKLWYRLFFGKTIMRNSEFDDESFAESDGRVSSFAMVTPKMSNAVVSTLHGAHSNQSFNTVKSELIIPVSPTSMTPSSSHISV